MFLVISSSLNPDSKSRILAKSAFNILEKNGETVEFLDLKELDLPHCDGAECYGHESSQLVAKKISEAKGIILAVPIYNYQAGSSAKNLIELTGKGWENTVVGFMCAAGGFGSMMSIMTLANSLMLDFRTFVLPRFVYSTGKDVNADGSIDGELEERIEGLANEISRVTKALID